MLEPFGTVADMCQLPCEFGGFLYLKHLAIWFELMVLHQFDHLYGVFTCYGYPHRSCVDIQPQDFINEVDNHLQ